MKLGITIAHYPGSPGAGANGFYEYDESGRWTKLLVAMLDAEVFVGPIGGLRRKVQALNEARCDVVLEIHFNAGPHLARGCETLYYPGSRLGRQLAERVQAGLVSAMETVDRGVKEGWYRMDRPGVVDYWGDADGDEMPNYFLRATNCPALILEPEFIHHRGHIQAHRVAAVTAIAQSIIR